MPPIQNQPFLQPKLVDIIGSFIEATTVRERNCAAARRLALPASGTDGDVSEGPPGRPVPLAALAEMPWLVNVVVVEVAELGFHALAPWARYDLLWPLLHCLIFAPFLALVCIPTVQCNRCSEELDPLMILLASLHFGHFIERERDS